MLPSTANLESYSMRPSVKSPSTEKSEMRDVVIHAKERPLVNVEVIGNFCLPSFLFDPLPPCESGQSISLPRLLCSASVILCQVIMASISSVGEAGITPPKRGIVSINS